MKSSNKRRHILKKDIHHSTIDTLKTGTKEMRGNIVLEKNIHIRIFTIEKGINKELINI